MVEVVIGATIISLALVFISYTIVLFLNSSDLAREQTKALYLAEEGHELLRYLRDEDWNTLGTLTEGSTYYLAVSSTSIAVSASPEVVDGVFTRSFVLQELNRDGNNDFVEIGGTVDSGSRIVEVTVSWDGRSVQLDSILTNIYDI